MAQTSRLAVGPPDRNHVLKMTKMRRLSGGLLGMGLVNGQLWTADGTNFIQRFEWSWCQRYVCDFMMVTVWRCRWQNHYIGDFSMQQNDHQHLKIVIDIHRLQHRWKCTYTLTTGRCTRFCLHFTRKISITELFLVSKTVPKIASSYFWGIKNDLFQFKAWLYPENYYLERKFPI